VIFLSICFAFLFRSYSDLTPPETEVTNTESKDSMGQVITPTPTYLPHDEERNRIRAIKELQKKAISSQSYCFSPMKRCAVLECCEKVELIIGRGYFQNPAISKGQRE
jgi:hypothetical protein